eukprot:NODE_426_length_8844_cov_0.449857.p4 type:complete len:204 gc:universal NODE_426_length_8844_cov_0.449857:4274-4885(+)
MLFTLASSLSLEYYSQPRILKREMSLSGKGEGTFFSLAGTTACETSQLDSDLVVALPQADYGEKSSTCGKCVMVTGAKGSIKATIQDMCPSCESGDLDMSPAVFQAAVGDSSIGRTSIAWVVVPCDDSAVPPTKDDTSATATDSIVENNDQTQPPKNGETQALLPTTTQASKETASLAVETESEPEAAETTLAYDFLEEIDDQ